MVNADGSETETNLLSVNQALEMFFDTFQDCFSYYLCDGKEHANTPATITLKKGALIGNLNDHQLLPISGEGLGISRFPYEWKQ